MKLLFLDFFVWIDNFGDENVESSSELDVFGSWSRLLVRV